MKKVLTMISLMSGILVFGACSQQEAAPSATQATAETVQVKETKPVQTRGTATSETTTENTAETTMSSVSSATPASDSADTTTYSAAATTQAQAPATSSPATESSTAVAKSSTVASSAAPVATADETTTDTTANTATETTDSTTPDMQSAFVEGERSDLKDTVPADLLNAYRTTISQAGVNGATYSDAMLTQYYYAGVRYGDFGTLLQMVAKDQGIPADTLLQNYYRYNGMDSTGNEAKLDATTMQAYRNCINLAGLDALSFSDEQLNGYYHEAHLSGDFGTLLRSVARDRGLDANQLVATYQANSNS